MDFRQIKVTNRLNGNALHNWYLYRNLAVEERIELIFVRVRFGKQVYRFNVIEDELNDEDMDLSGDDLQEFWENVVEKHIIEQLNSVKTSERRTYDELVQINEYGELRYDRDVI